MIPTLLLLLVLGAWLEHVADFLEGVRWLILVGLMALAVDSRFAVTSAAVLVVVLACLLWRWAGPKTRRRV